MLFDEEMINLLMLLNAGADYYSPENFVIETEGCKFKKPTTRKLDLDE